MISVLRPLTQHRAGKLNRSQRIGTSGAKIFCCCAGGLRADFGRTTCGPPGRMRVLNLLKRLPESGHQPFQDYVICRKALSHEKSPFHSEEALFFLGYFWTIMVGTRGFEPPSSCTPSKRANQAAPRPDKESDTIMATFSQAQSLPALTGVPSLSSLPPGVFVRTSPWLGHHASLLLGLAQIRPVRTAL